MYFLLGLCILLAIFFLILTHWNAGRIRKKICGLTPCEKSKLLNELTTPFGFSYRSGKDLFTSRLDAWQREAGYHALYDLAAPHAQMIFHCEPIYFNAHGVTWLVELWKGQYGINTGAEIGIYHADTIIPPEDFSSTLFQAAGDNELPLIYMELWKQNQLLFRYCQYHWWLTGFLIGCFSQPEELTLNTTLTFRDREMAEAFGKALLAQKYPASSLLLKNTSVSFSFSQPSTAQPCQRCPLNCRFSQWKNHWFCRLYLWVTKPFCRTDDRLLYLYYFLPFTFRQTVQVCKPRRYKSRRSAPQRYKSHRMKGRKRS